MGRRYDADKIRLLFVEHLFEVRIVSGDAVFFCRLLRSFRMATGHGDDLSPGVRLKDGNLNIPTKGRARNGDS